MASPEPSYAQREAAGTLFSAVSSSFPLPSGVSSLTFTKDDEIARRAQEAEACKPWKGKAHILAGGEK